MAIHYLPAQYPQMVPKKKKSNPLLMGLAAAGNAYAQYEFNRLQQKDSAAMAQTAWEKQMAAKAKMQGWTVTGEGVDPDVTLNGEKLTAPEVTFEDIVIGGKTLKGTKMMKVGRDVKLIQIPESHTTHTVKAGDPKYPNIKPGTILQLDENDTPVKELVKGMAPIKNVYINKKTNKKFEAYPGSPMDITYKTNPDLEPGAPVATKAPRVPRDSENFLALKIKNFKEENKGKAPTARQKAEWMLEWRKSDPLSQLRKALMGGETKPQKITLPDTVKTTRQAMDWLVDNEDMTIEEARTWLMENIPTK